MTYNAVAIASDGTRYKYKKLLHIEKNNLECVYVGVSLNDKYLSGETCCEISISDLDIKSYTAIYKYSDYWLRPFFSDDVTLVPQNTQCLIYKTEDNKFGVLLPVCGKQFKCTLEGSASGGILAKLYSGCKLQNCSTLAFITATGDNPYELIERAVSFAVGALDGFSLTRKDRKFPSLFEYLGWCSWDALQIRVSEKGLLDKCEEFKKKGIPVKWIIIDDMWADVTGLNKAEYDSFKQMISIMHKSMLNSYKADPVRFPNGLENCINKINEYGIEVGIWHPTTGYWNGIDPHGKAAKDEFKNLFKSPAGKLIHPWQFEFAYDYYNTIHTYLKNSGAVFVKIDNQSSIQKNYKGETSIGEAARNIHMAIEKSVDDNFDGRLINCMGMASENMFNRPFSPISRCSDDFLPENREWFSKHILQCSYNSFLQGQFIWCDWDMWWTDDGQAEKNSILRAISGGPIYISDKVGRTIKQILDPLVYSDGRILRCDLVATPAIDCLTVDPLKSKSAFKIWNRVGNFGVVAAFNINSKNNSVSANVSPSDCGLPAGDYAIYEYFSKSCKAVKKGEAMEFLLKDNDCYKLFIISPINDGVAVIGRPDKFICPHAVKSFDSQSAVLSEDGELVFYSEQKREHFVVNGNKRIVKELNGCYIC